MHFLLNVKTKKYIKKSKLKNHILHTIIFYDVMQTNGIAVGAAALYGNRNFLMKKEELGFVNSLMENIVSLKRTNITINHL